MGSGGSDVTLKLDGETADYNRKVKQADANTKAIGKSARDATKEWEKQIPLLRQINAGTVDIALKAGVAAAAIGGIAAAWKHVEDAREKAATAALSQADSAKRLAQVADSPNDFLSLRNDARRFAATLGIDQSRANNAVFNLKSAGDLQSLGLFERAGMIEGDIESLITGVHTTKGAFGSTSEQSLNRLLAASKQSKFGVSELAQGAAVAGKAVAATGTSESQFLALLGSEFGTKTAEVTATGLRAFAAESANNSLLSGMRGSSLIETTKNIQAFMKERGIGDKDLGQVVKSIEAQQGFRTITSAINGGGLDASVAGIEGSAGLVDQLKSNLDTQTLAASNFRRSEANMEIASETEGVTELIQNANFNNKMALKTPNNFVSRYWAYVSGKFDDAAGRGIIGNDDINAAMKYTNETGDEVQARNAIGMEDLNKNMRRIAESNEAMNRRDENSPNRGVKE